MVEEQLEDLFLIIILWASFRPLYFWFSCQIIATFDLMIIIGRLAFTSQPTGGGQLAEPAGDMDRSDELDLGGAHDAGRSSEEDPG